MIAEHFRDIAHQYPEELAIVDGEQRFTYRDLERRIAAFSSWMKKTIDPGPGDVIAATLTNSWQSVACFFAVAGLGGVFVPCNPQWRARELRWFAGRLGFRGVISEQEFVEEWKGAGDVLPPDRVWAVDEAARACESGLALNPPAVCRRSEEDAALYLTTSGSTGAPRIVPRSHRNLAAGARNTARALRIGPGHRFLSVVPFHHSSGFHNSLLLPLLNGACAVLVRRFAPVSCADLAGRERVNILIGSPAIYGLLSDRVGNPRLLSTLETCISAGARMPAAAAARWQERFGVRVRQLYGSSETSVISIDCADREPPPAIGGAFVGAPIPEVEVRCLGPDGEDPGPGGIGELAVRSPAVTSGYLGEPEWNAQAFRNGFFRTGDLGYLDADGNVYLTGKLRRVINLGGVKVDPVEVEQALELLPGVSACHVDAAPDGREGHVIRARVALRQGAHLIRSELISHCRARLAEYKLPRVIEFVETLPTTISGKIPKDWIPEEGPD